MVITISILLVGFIVLFWSADRLVNESVQIAKLYHVSPMVIGIILVGFMTALPECVISITSAIHGYGHLAIGNALGSYMANIALVLGITLLVAPIKVHRSLITSELLIMCGSLLVTWGCFLDRQFSLFDGGVLFFLFIIYSIYLYHAARYSSKQTQSLLQQQEKKAMPEIFKPSKSKMLKIIAKLSFHLVVMLVSVHFITDSAVDISHKIGLGEFFIGATVLAIGTSLPELAAAVVAVRKGAFEIVLGNIIGSNIINLWVVLPLASVNHPIQIPSLLLHRDMWFFLIVTVLIMPQLCTSKPMVTYGRVLGGALLLMFMAYIWALLHPHFFLWA
jgi:cation:H+ antiporter